LITPGWRSEFWCEVPMSACRCVRVGGLAVQDPRGKSAFSWSGPGWVVRLLRLFLGVQVYRLRWDASKRCTVERDSLAVAQILADLRGHVVLGLERIGQRRILRLDALQGAGHPYGREVGRPDGEDRMPVSPTLTVLLVLAGGGLWEGLHGGGEEGSDQRNSGAARRGHLHP
jgi:hypothetical protein